MRRLLCFVFGGHAWSLPQVVKGRVRLVCQYGCGAMSTGVETLGQERQRAQRHVPYKNLQLIRGQRDPQRRQRIA